MRLTRFISKYENRISCCIDDFIHNYPFLGFILSIVGTSILIIAIVGICTAIFAVVISSVFWFFES